MREKFLVLDIVVHHIIQGLLFRVCGYHCMTLYLAASSGLLCIHLSLILCFKTDLCKVGTCFETVTGRAAAEERHHTSVTVCSGGSEPGS